MERAIARHRGRARASGSPSSSARASCSRPSGCACAPTYDLEMMREVGSCSGIENYSRHIDGREPGTAPDTPARLLPRGLPRSSSTSPTSPCRRSAACTRATCRRKRTLVDHGFRLPSAMDNRPLRWEEFVERIGQTVYLSATPGPYELARPAAACVEQIIRPDRPGRPRGRRQADQGPDRRPACTRSGCATERDERVLVTTLTKKMAEDLTDYLLELGIRVRYLHSEVDTLRRVELLRELRLGEFDVLVGHQPAARGPRPARGVAGRDPRRRQGGLPALGDAP